MPKRTAGRFRIFLVGGLLALLVFCLVSFWLTRDAGVRMRIARRGALVDIQPWQTAEALAARPASVEEAEYAREAQHLADREVDQAFAAALREASLHKPVLKGEALELSRKVADLQTVVATDQASVRDLTAHDPDDELDIAKAQLALDTDQLNEAQQDLARAGGDERGLVQQELTVHEAGMKSYDAKANALPTVPTGIPADNATIASCLPAWFDQRTRTDLLLAASNDALEAVTALTAKHKQLEEAKPTTPAPSGKAERLAHLSDQATRSQLLAIYDDRISTERQLSSVYLKWSDEVSLQHRNTAHQLTKSLALIVLILFGVIVFDALALRFVSRSGMDRRRMETMGSILKFSLQVIGVLLILLVIFGVPTQTPTILGLATAGLTVALQDFIIAFFGWFVLMGKNGIHVGDLVEINDVAGEVVHVGLFRTALLETGNSTEKGHPTGRRITFSNSFAIKGQYFNHTTTGQWTWDEIRVTIPPQLDTYATIELVRKEVLDQTAQDTDAAKEEWKRVSLRFTAEPAVDMRPGSTGIDLIVRYVTRASDRYEARNRLYGRVLNLLHSQTPKELR
ncbi:MAG: mechanosensitive ion channel domain-containing protein [Bryobacteraceae bacterium]